MVNELNLLVIFYQSKTIAYENIEAFEKVAEAVSNKLLPGQEDIEIQTKSAILTCRRAKIAALTDHPINAGNASVNFPDLQELIGNETVDVQVCLVQPTQFLSYSSLASWLCANFVLREKKVVATACPCLEMFPREYPEPSLFVLHQNVAVALKAEVTSYLESKYNQEGISFGIKACSLIVV